MAPTSEHAVTAPALRHRGDIDGLRAVAILPILLFHAGVSALAGGFVGVDVFFVISGFLITSIIVRELDAGRFSLLTFYRRRVVRIFPALFVMLAIVLAVGAWLLLPIEFDRLAQSTMAAMGFASNFYFWQISDYFAPDAELMPLLHTWSLGVEEQFYIFFPLAMLVIARFVQRRFRLLLTLAAIGSFAVGMVVAMGSPVAAFYLLPVRAWELMAGALVSVYGLADSRAVGPRMRNAAAWLGAALLAAAIVLVRDGRWFPMPQALVPTLGAALTIAFAQGTGFGKVLAWAPLRYIGRISYSVYLWHWPLIALWRIETGLALDSLETLGLVIASLIAGALSYHLVEQPFLRRFRVHGSAGKVVGSGLAVLAGGLALTWIAMTTAPQWRHIDPDVARVAAYDDYLARPEYQYQFRRGPCFRGEAQAAIAFDPAQCTALSATKPNVVVLGDSYAAQYWRAIALRLPDSNVMQAAASGCRPLVAAGGEVRCREVVDYVLGPLVASGRVSTVVLAGRWLPEDLSAIPRTVAYLQNKGIRVIVIGRPAEYQGTFPSILARAMMRHDSGWVGRWRVAEDESFDRDLAAVVRPTGATYISALRIMCPGTCRLRTDDGAPMQFDYGHLTLPGARYVINHAFAGLTL